MFLEFDDDEITAWGWPWHGPINSLDGLAHPSRPVPFSRVLGGIHTTLFDIGRPDPVTPAEIADQGGEILGRSILRWSGDGASFSSPGFQLRGAPITVLRDEQLEVAAWVSLSFGTFGSSGIAVTGTARVLHNGQLFTQFSVSRQYPGSDIGQGAGQPDIELFRGSRMGAGVVGGMRGTLLDVREIRLLVGLYAQGVGDGAFLSFPERPRMLIGLIELPVMVEDGFVYMGDAVVIESRAAALGTRTQLIPPAWVPPITYMNFTVEVVIDTLDTDTCTGEYRAEGAPGMQPVATVTGWQAFEEDGVQRERIEGGLLLARYGADGGIETARYDAVFEVEREGWRRFEPGPGARVVHTRAKPIPLGCEQETLEDQRDRSVIIDYRRDTLKRFRHVLYGFDGAEVDRNEYLAITAEAMKVKHYEFDLLDEVIFNTYSHSIEINGEPVAAPGSVIGYGYSREGVGQAILSANSCGSFYGGFERSAIWQLSNMLACLVRQTPDTNSYLTAGPAVTPSGADTATYPSSINYSSTYLTELNYYLTGSWNPVTGEVARCAVDRFYSWA